MSPSSRRYIPHGTHPIRIGPPAMGAVGLTLLLMGALFAFGGACFNIGYHRVDFDSPATTSRARQARLALILGKTWYPRIALILVVVGSGLLLAKWFV